VFEILQKREIAPNVHQAVIHAPAIAKKARPGQFVIVMVDERSERVPFTLCDWDRQAGTITLVVQEVGQSSRKFVLLKAGDRIAHLVGPLGVPLEIEKYGTVALAAGCYGIGAVLSIARALKQAGNRVITIVEANSQYLHYYRDELLATSDEMIQTTTDGSNGTKGHSVDVIKRKLENGEPLDRVLAVGCVFMMMLAANTTKPFGVKTLVALNPIMLDGTGMCGACRVTVANETKFACVDGPFFDGHQVDWEELFDRRAAYSEEEIRSVARTEAAAPRPHGHAV
jgi:NAD(P)H-flavin reductase